MAIARNPLEVSPLKELGKRFNPDFEPRDWRWRLAHVASRYVRNYRPKSKGSDVLIELSEKSNMNRETLNQFLRGQRCPAAGELEKLGRVLDFTLESIYDEASALGKETQEELQATIENLERRAKHMSW